MNEARTETIESQADGIAKQPERRCICCRSNDSKSALLRFGLIQNVLCFDLRKKLPGRGYYVCASKTCLEKAFGGGFKRATKHESREIATSLSEFVQMVLLPGLHKRYRECLQAGFQSGMLLSGADSVEEAAKTDRLAAYILATDASESSRKKYETNAERKKIPCFGLYEAAIYGQMFGKSDKVILGWKACRLLKEFSELETAIKRLSEEFRVTQFPPSDSGA